MAGFELEPGPDHLARSSKSMLELAEVINRASTFGTTKEVRAGHLISGGFVTPQLYAFVIPEVAPDGQLVDGMAPGTTLRFAVLANHPAAEQVEHTIAFLNSLLARQEYVSQISAGEDSSAIRQLDLTVHALDATARDQSVEDLTEGWRQAAIRVVHRASDLGIKFDLRYEPGPIFNRENIASRVRLHKRVYNELSSVRTAIDKTVSLIGSGDFQLRGGLPSMRIELQQKTASSFLMKYWSHTFRDALVCGNGYLCFRHGDPFSFYNVEPERVIVLAADRFAVVEDGIPEELRDHVMQLPGGFKQLESPYGVSLLELFAMDFAKDHIFQEAIGKTKEALSSQQNTEAESWLKGLEEQHERVRQETDRRVDTLLPGPANPLGDPQELYFPGHELYGVQD